MLCYKIQIMPVFISSSSNDYFFPSQCSKTCGRGVKKRDVYCKSTGSPSAKILPESMCSRDHKPESQQTCVLGRCPKNERLQWVISSWSEVKHCSSLTPLPAFAASSLHPDDVVRCTLNVFCFSGLPLTWIHISVYALWNMLFVVLVI